VLSQEVSVVLCCCIHYRPTLVEFEEEIKLCAAVYKYNSC
jgi:hypothetical protein